MYESLSFLVVEDSRLLLTFIRDMLFDLGAVNVRTAVNGKEAAEIVRSQAESGKTFDVIFTDIEMPEMNGIDFLKEAKQHLDFSKMAILVVSSKNEEEIVKQVAALRVDAYVLKPFERDLFRSRLKQIIARKFTFSPI